MSRSDGRTNRKGRPREPDEPHGHDSKLPLQLGRTDTIIWGDCGTRPDGSLPPGVTIRPADSPIKGHQPGAGSWKSAIAASGPWKTAIAPEQARLLGEFPNPLYDAAERGVADLIKLGEGDDLMSTLFWEAMAAGHPEFEKDRVYEWLLEFRNRSRVVGSTFGSMLHLVSVADGQERADDLLRCLARRNVGVRMAGALQEFSRGPRWAISPTARNQIAELFGAWPGHRKVILLSEGNWNWHVLEGLRREYVKDLIIEIKCPPVEFLVKLLSWPNLDDAGVDSAKQTAATDWHQRLLRTGGDWYEDFARQRHLPYKRKRVRSFGRIARRLANFCRRTGLSPVEMTTAVNYGDPSKASAFVRLVGAMVSGVPFGKANPDTGWPKFSRRVEREVKDWNYHPNGPFQPID
jgi:hypothetical protein